jgi:hypothetical protein
MYHQSKFRHPNYLRKKSLRYHRYIARKALFKKKKERINNIIKLLEDFFNDIVQMKMPEKITNYSFYCENENENNFQTKLYNKYQIKLEDFIKLNEYKIKIFINFDLFHINTKFNLIFNNNNKNNLYFIYTFLYKLKEFMIFTSFCNCNKCYIYYDHKLYILYQLFKAFSKKKIKRKINYFVDIFCFYLYDLKNFDN